MAKYPITRVSSSRGMALPISLPSLSATRGTNTGCIALVSLVVSFHGALGKPARFCKYHTLLYGAPAAELELWPWARSPLNSINRGPHRRNPINRFSRDRSFNFAVYTAAYSHNRSVECKTGSTKLTPVRLSEE